jgi:hypothetical protein
MKPMTYGDLLFHLQSLDLHELVMNVTIHIKEVDEFIPVHNFYFNGGETNTQDEGHPYMVSLPETRK